MKKLILIFATCLLVFSCKKDPEPGPTTGRITFYTSKDSIQNNNKWKVFFASEQAGLTKYSETIPECGASGFLTVEKPGGQYLVYFQYYYNGTPVDSQYVTITNGVCNVFEYK